MNWFIIVLIIGILFISFCIGYMFGLSKNKELDKKYFKGYEFIKKIIKVMRSK